MGFVHVFKVNFHSFKLMLCIFVSYVLCLTYYSPQVDLHSKLILGHFLVSSRFNFIVKLCTIISTKRYVSHSLLPFIFLLFCILSYLGYWIEPFYFHFNFIIWILSPIQKRAIWYSLGFLDYAFWIGVISKSLAWGLIPLAWVYKKQWKMNFSYTLIF